MSRNVTKSVPGSYSVKTNGVLISTVVAQKSLSVVNRPDAAPGVRDGEWIHPTSYFTSKTLHVGPYGTWTKGDTVYTGDLYSLSTASYQAVGWEAPSYKPSILARAVIDARTKLAGDGFNFLQNIAERQQAIDLVGDRLISIYRAYRSARSAISAYRRGNMNERRWKHWQKEWRAAFKHLGLHKNDISRRLSENVLAWNYGAAPLIDDVDKAIQMFSNPKSLSPMIGVTGKAHEGDPQSYRFVEEKTSGVPRLLTYSELRSARCVLFVNPDNVKLIKAAALKVNNPALLAWELIPYSFLVDWVMPIGDWIDSIGSTAGWSFYSGYTMERTWCRTLFSSLKTPNNGTSVIEGSRERLEFRRARLSAFPIPTFPGFKNPWSLEHALNAVALFGASRR